MQEVLPTSLLAIPPGRQVSNGTLQPDEGVRPPPGLTLHGPRSQSLVEDPVSRECVSLVPVVRRLAFKERFHRGQMRRWEKDEQ